MNLNELRTIVTRATRPGSFYRRLYGMRDSEAALRIASWDDWQKIPLLSKKNLLDAKLHERSFVALRHVDYITSSSGTTGSLPLFSPRARLSEYEFRKDMYTPHGPALSSKLVPHQQETFFFKRNRAPHVVVIDPRNPAATARLARAAGVDSIFAFLFHIPLIAEHLKREGVAKNIQFIEVAGEACSRSLFTLMHETFPHATIISTYGLSEIESSPIGLPCHPMTIEDSSQLFHAKDGVFFEIVDDQGRVIDPVEGVEGELVITAYGGEPAAFPAVRYKSGDTARVTETACAAHGTWSFIILGRVDVDFIKISGGMLKAEEIERVLRDYEESVSDTFELRISERNGKTAATLFLMCKDSISLPDIAEEIAQRLRVSPVATYADKVEEGVCLPLVCVRMEKGHETLGKRQRIIRDSTR